MDAPNTRKEYWRKNKALIRNLLLIWAIVSMGMGILLVELLNSLKVGRVPFGFWMAQQGSIYVFVGLIFVYATQMDKLDRTYSDSRTRAHQDSTDMSHKETHRTFTR